ncbi:iron transporter [Vibrio cholerae]|nr:iron transporter [Vibrio cholerae]
MVSVVVFEFSGMRCQPLRRALCKRSQLAEYLLFSSYHSCPYVNYCFLCEFSST